MNYNLNTILSSEEKKSSLYTQLKSVFSLMKDEKWFLLIACITLIVNAVCTLAGPYLTGYAIDVFVLQKSLDGLTTYTLLLLGIYLVAFIANFIQIRVMGAVGQRVLFVLRNKIFKKIQELPVQFFSQNKTGDIIARINSDTEKLSQFFSETLTRFLGSIFMIGGAAVFLVIIHPMLGTATLLPAVLLWIFTFFISKYVTSVNKKALTESGNLSAEVQESIQNFKVIVAFNRRDYFRSKFKEVNEKAFMRNYASGVVNGIFTPLYDFAANMGQYVVLLYGIFLITQGEATVGILVSFLAYAEKFYNPLRQMAQLWSSVQVSIAAWMRIRAILDLTTNMKMVEGTETTQKGVITFENVTFSYVGEDGETTVPVLEHLHFTLEEGKTYALVGPTGGGKTTTASLMARLYDPSEGVVYLHGKDIRSYKDEERVLHIGFILQDPVVFRGTVRENLMYGNPKLNGVDLNAVLTEKGMEKVFESFDNGIDTEIPKNIDSMSLGQKQIIAFVRAVLREPALLILDEATANIDTVTEEILQEIVNKLPQKTTKVIIAHRLNTIENADTIFFVNNKTITEAGSIEHAVELLLKNKKKS